MVKHSDIILFFHLHISLLCGSWDPQRIFQKEQFWKYDSWFSSEVSKLTSVRNNLNLSRKYWFMEAKNVYWTYHAPIKGSKYHVETEQTSFGDDNKYYKTIFVKLNFFHAWKCIISGVKYRSKFWHLRRKPAVIFSEWIFFQNSLEMSWAIWSGKMQVKK